MNDDGMSWAGASWARSLELAELDYQAWRPKQAPTSNPPTSATDAEQHPSTVNP